MKRPGASPDVPSAGRGGHAEWYAADDGAALHCQGGHLLEVVSSRPAAFAYRVEFDGSRVVETRLPVRFLGATDSTATEQVTQKWFARPVLFVSDLQVALRFHLDTLGFKKKWHAGDGKGTVCQVDRGETEILLCEDSERHDKGRLFVDLARDGLDGLRREIVERSVPAQKAWWGYDVIRIADPDGNELLFPLDDTNDRERQK